ncbi:MAG TPA: 3'(2'),5'-bisphosphate nucleotidase CysQ [Micropepsaceae bacterium]|nr:3'(2'),5'-bisphosphate nucleotidase CysQ [Micropepsaceae bacterium]
MPAPDSAADTALLANTLRRAGEIARHYYGGKYRSWEKSRGNPVTEADIEIDRFLKHTLLSARPEYGWLSEETEDDPARLQREFVFIADPIDGTHGFLKQRPHFTIVAAVVHQGRPVSAAIFNPITGEMFEAVKGKGAKKNGVAISVSDRRTFEGARILAERKLMEPARWSSPWPDTLTSETRSSAAYRIALVAAGEFDATLSLTRKSDWDVAAGDLIVHEAGGIITDREGNSLVYNRQSTEHPNLVCARPELHARLLARLKDYRPAT